nr:endonuclease/exonuclease/phosphatase family protein [Tanacetum cinerariifolium]
MYITWKVSKLGKRFSFIHYAKVIDERKLEAQLQMMWIGNFHLFIYVARFNRENTTKTNNLKKQEGEKVKDTNTMQGKNIMHGLSYANMVKGSEGALSPQHVKPIRKIVLGLGDYQQNKDYNRIALGEVNNATMIPQLLRVCYDEGFDEVKINYVGSEGISRDRVGSCRTVLRLLPYAPTPPPPSASQVASMRFVEALNQQINDICSQLANKNIHLPLLVPIDPNELWMMLMMKVMLMKMLPTPEMSRSVAVAVVVSGIGGCGGG